MNERLRFAGPPGPPGPSGPPGSVVMSPGVISTGPPVFSPGVATVGVSSNVVAGASTVGVFQASNTGKYLLWFDVSMFYSCASLDP